MDCCSSSSIIFPMTAEVYYPSVEQSGYGNVRKTWMLNRVVAGSFSPAGSKIKEEVAPNVDISMDSLLTGMCPEDLRVTVDGENMSTTNVLITNIKDKHGNKLFTETSGPRAGQATLFEIATQQPHMSPFGGIEYYKLILRRSQNQGVDL